MAGGGLLQSGEESWSGALDNLIGRFAHIDPATVAETLRQNGGHAGRTAQALRKLPETSSKENRPAAAPEAASLKKEKRPAAVEKAAIAPETSSLKKAAAPDAKSCSKPEVTTTTLAPQEAAAAPPAPDSNLLFVAALQGNMQMLKDLIVVGADLNARYTGKPNRSQADKIIEATPLHLVVIMGRADVAEVLVRSGADVEAKMQRMLGAGSPPREHYADMTVLHLAAMEGHAEIVKMLLAFGADKEMRMQLMEHYEQTNSERYMSPVDIALEMSGKGYPRDAVIAQLCN